MNILLEVSQIEHSGTIKVPIGTNNWDIKTSLQTQVKEKNSYILFFVFTMSRT